jgi:hypothetical protein
MLNFILWDEANEREERAVGVSHALQLGDPPEGFVWHPITGAIGTTTLAMVDGAMTEILRPKSLPSAKAERWQEALAFRSARQDGGCMTPHGRVDTDPDSQRKINGAATAALVTQLQNIAFPPIGWTMADNSVVVHDRASVIAMGLAVVSFLNDCQAAGTAIRNEIDAAETIEQVAAIDIKAGFPA